MKELCADLAAECLALDAIVADLEEPEWEKVTPFYGWTIRDEISHLAYFDRMARLSASNEDAFNAEMAALIQDVENIFKTTLQPGREKTVEGLLQWWRDEREAMITAFEPLDPKTRVPWHLPMSVRSSATARLMETWAHGQDVVDALDARRTPTDRLRHIAHLGVATYGWSFACRGREAPTAPVRVELEGPSGDAWTWGPGDAGDIVRGDAEDFCLLVAQRRHLEDTGLEITGDAAVEWMSVAQLFAGPPAEGPGPGEFSKWR